jgi:tripartite-type tricarboxylate transporter receptor subunit TctC
MIKIFVAFFISIFSISAIAKETVTIVYSWTAADGPANYSRAIIDEANKIQSKYYFIFDTKPGAGGSVAANYVKNTPNTILATASAFFVRPNFFPNESYDLSAYKEIYLQCTAPMAITAIKYKTWGEVPKDRPLTIGVSGLGTTTHLFASQIQKKYPNLTVIPFKSTSESLLSVAAGNTDLHVAFLGEVETWGADDTKFKRLNVLGISGSSRVRGFPTLASQGFGKTVADIGVPFHLVVPTSVPDAKFKEWRDILVRAGRAVSVKETYKLDACVPRDLRDDEIEPWYHAQVAKWQRLSTGVKLDR